MSSLKEDILTILRIWVPPLVFLLVFHYMPAWVLAVLSLGFWGLKLYDSFHYRLTKPSDQIRFPTRNDLFYRMTSLLLGGAGMLAIIWLYLREEAFSLDGIYYFLVAGMIFTNGMLRVPTGRLALIESSLAIFPLDAKIDLQEIQLVKIGADQIIIIDDNLNTRVKQFNLELDDSWRSRIADFFSHHIPHSKVELV